MIEYFSSVSNIFDWAHFALMAWAWMQWSNYVNESFKFRMDTEYRILRSPEEQAPARILMTNGFEEQKFLNFSGSLTNLDQVYRMYINTQGLCGEEKSQGSLCLTERLIKF